MKLFKHLRKRLFKKFVGKRYKILLFGATLCPGDIISTCKGYNAIITKIEPVWYSFGAASYIFDFDLETNDGGSCSLWHCCQFPIKTKKEVIEYNLAWDQYRTYEPLFGKEFFNRIDAVKSGIEVFDGNGCLI